MGVCIHVVQCHLGEADCRELRSQSRKVRFISYVSQGYCLINNELRTCLLRR
jgi:hypothetical protein